MSKKALFGFGLSAVLLMATGLLVISTASQPNSLRLFHDAGYHFLIRQSCFAVAGVLIAVFLARLDYHIWRSHTWFTILSYLVVFGLLGAVFLFPKVNGSHRWIVVGPLRLQPGELAKLMTIIATAVWLDCCSWKVGLFHRGFLMTALVIAGMAGLVLLEPDFGSVMVIGVVGALMMFISGVKIPHLVLGGAFGGAVVGYKLLNNANRMARLGAWMPQWLYDRMMSLLGGAGAEVTDAATKQAEYQAHQALVALKNGGLWGVGINQSIQKEFYLPEAHTDFIFAIGAEERGIIFSVIVMLLFVLFFYCSIYIARHASDRFGRNLAYGMGFLIFFQAMFNIGVVCSALPTKGMALPFFSYGGTNLLAAAVAVGTILSVGIYSLKEREHALMRKVVSR